MIKKPENRMGVVECWRLPKMPVTRIVYCFIKEVRNVDGMVICINERIGLENNLESKANIITNATNNLDVLAMTIDFLEKRLDVLHITSIY